MIRGQVHYTVSLWCFSNSTSNCKSSIVLNLLRFAAEAFIVGLIINCITIIKMRSNKWLMYSNKSVSWKSVLVLYHSNTPLLAFDVFSLICWRKFSFSSRYIPRCFWQAVCATRASLKYTMWWSVFLYFREKITFCVCLVISGLKDIFHWLAKLMLIRSLFIISAESKGLKTVGKSDASSGNNFVKDSKLSGMWFIYTKKSKGPNIEPCGTPARIGDQFEDWPLRITLWDLSLRKL